MTPRQRLFGEIAVRLKRLSREQLTRAQKRMRSNPGEDLATAAKELGFLSDADVSFVIEQQERLLSKRRAKQRSGMLKEIVVPPGQRRSRRDQPAAAPEPSASAAHALAITAAAAGPMPTASRPPPTPPAAAAHVAAEHAAPEPARETTAVVPAGAASTAQSEALEADGGEVEVELDLEPGPARTGTPPMPLSLGAPVLELAVEPKSGGGTGADFTPATVGVADQDPPRAAPPESRAPQDVSIPLPAPSLVGATSERPGASARPSMGAGAQVAISGFPPAAVPGERHSLMPSSRGEAQQGEFPELDAPVPKGPEPYFIRAARFALEQGSSDLHLHAGSPLHIRSLGTLQPLDPNGPKLSPAATRAAVAEVLTDGQWERLHRDGEVDLALDVAGLGRARANAFRQQLGYDLVARLVPDQPPTLDELNLPQTLKRFLDYRTGLVLCTGPAGCGKSTTLAAMVGALAKSRKEHVLTLEDPIEFIYQKSIALVNQRQVHSHTESFARALRAALREDPDIIAITELRDRETISLALSAAETGHLVFGTLHTGSAGQTINRIISVFPSEEQAQIRVMLSESLRAVVSQRLVRKKDGSGRVPALEILVVTPAVGNLIRDDKTFQLPSIMQTGRAMGMVTMDDSLAALVQSGEVSKEEARKNADKKERFR